MTILFKNLGNRNNIKIPKDISYKEDITTEQYIKMISNIKIDNPDLKSYKAYKAYKDNKLLTRKDFVNFKLDEVDIYKESSPPLQQLNSKNEASSYCDIKANSGKEECICYDIFKLDIQKHEEELRKYDLIWDSKIQQNQIMKQNYNIFLENYPRKVREKRIELEEVIHVQDPNFIPCCLFNESCQCEPGDRLVRVGPAYVKDGICKMDCKYTQKEIESILKNDYPEPKEPAYFTIPPKPTFVSNIECCVNIIKNTRDVKDVKQRCNQTIVEQILERKAKEEEKEEAERKAKEEEKEEAERKAKEEEKEEAERKAREEEKEEDERKAREEEKEEAERKAREEEKEEAERKSDNTYIYISISLIILLLLIIGFTIFLIIKT